MKYERTYIGSYVTRYTTTLCYILIWPHLSQLTDNIFFSSTLSNLFWCKSCSLFHLGYPCQTLNNFINLYFRHLRITRTRVTVVATTYHKGQMISLMSKPQSRSIMWEFTRELNKESLLNQHPIYTKYIWSVLQPYVCLISYSRPPCCIHVP